MKKRKKGPSCFGSIMLFLAVVLVLKYAYGNMSSDNEDENAAKSSETLYDELYEGLRTYSTEIEFDYDCTAELFETLDRVRGDHPELFWVSGSGQYKKYTRGDDVTVTFFADTELTLVEILKFKSEIDLAADDILSKVNPDWSDYEKLLYIHDVLVNRTEYDSECAEAVQMQEDCAGLWQSSSIYGCLVGKRAICSGYAASFQFLAEELGIECIRVSGHERGTGMPHEWNCVRLGERWYYVDVTWDDPLYENEDSYFVGSRSYEYFMITEDTLSITHVIDEDESVPVCDDDSYNYYKRNGVYLDEYSFDAAAGIIGSQLGGDIAVIAFPTKAAAESAADDLFGNYRFYDIEEAAPFGNSSVTYTVGETGLLRIAVIG